MVLPAKLMGTVSKWTTLSGLLSSGSVIVAQLMGGCVKTRKMSQHGGGLWIPNVAPASTFAKMLKSIVILTNANSQFLSKELGKL